MECKAKKLMLVICLEMLNIEWGQIDPKGHRRVKPYILTRGTLKAEWFELVFVSSFSYGKIPEKKTREAAIWLFN